MQCTYLNSPDSLRQQLPRLCQILLNLAQLASISQVERTSLGFVADDACAVWVCTAVGILVALLAEEAPAVSHDKTYLFIAYVAFELLHYWSARF
jgi:hypothetical protein